MKTSFCAAVGLLAAGIAAPAVVNASPVTAQVGGDMVAFRPLAAGRPRDEWSERSNKRSINTKQQQLLR